MKYHPALSGYCFVDVSSSSSSPFPLSIQARTEATLKAENRRRRTKREASKRFSPVEDP